MLRLWRLKRFFESASLSPVEARKGDTKWINVSVSRVSTWLTIKGLRGVCASCVVCHHLFMGLRGDVIYPGSEHARTHGIWHWPFFHAFTEGYQWVVIFLILAGWVNALKPLQAMNRGETNTALLLLCKGSFRRPLRLMIPAGIITLTSGFMAQLDLFHYGGHATLWITQGSPAPMNSSWAALQRLWESLWASWFGAGNYYERNQWVMTWFLEGSWKLYSALLPMTIMHPTWRRIVVALHLWWAWSTHESQSHFTLAVCY
jgi:hypothetical protein